jgi:CheY-like chemotaxis protein
MKPFTAVAEPETITLGVGDPPTRVPMRDRRGGETVVVVVHEKFTREFIVTVLRALGYEVLESADVTEAARLLKRRQGEPVDLVVTNLAAPVTGGRLLPDKLRRVFSNHRMLYCADAPESLTRQSWSTNYEVPLLQKPFSAKQLAEKVRSVVDHPLPTGHAQRAGQHDPFSAMTQFRTPAEARLKDS